MDPVRGLMHLGLKTTEAALDRTLGLVRLVDTLLVASAVPPARGDEPERAWPDEEQADLDALSQALRAREGVPDEAGDVVATTPARRGAARTTKATSKRTTAPRRSAATKPAAKKAPAKTPATKTSAAKAPTQKSTVKKAAAKKATTKKAAKATPRKAAAQQAATVTPTEPAPTLTVLPDA